jgi:hypothetical protein
MTRKIANSCLARRANARHCHNTGVRTVLGIPLCDTHVVEMARLFGNAEPVKVVQVATKGPHVVYYAGNPVTQLVKIGTSHDFRTRLGALRARFPGVKLLAVEPGHFDLEALRHRQFGHLRATGPGVQREWFHKADDLMVHINEVWKAHGPPEHYRT